MDLMNSSQTDRMAPLAKVGALILGSHIVYTSGKHGTAYINKDAVYPHTEIVRVISGDMASAFSGDRVEVVVGPQMGGVILSQWIAHWLQSRNTTHDVQEVLSVYAEKEGDTFVLRRGYEKLVPGKRVLVVEDVLTTGGSVLKVVQAVRALGGEVIGVSAMCNRGGVTSSDIGDVPKLYSYVEVSLSAWDEDACPMCAEGIPVNTDVGKGREFLARAHRG